MNGNPNRAGATGQPITNLWNDRHSNWYKAPAWLAPAFTLYASLYPGIVTAEARVGTTANRMARDIGWENLWLILLFLLFVVYPLLISITLMVAGKLKGIEGLLHPRWVLKSFLVAVLGLLVAFILFVLIILGAIIFHMDIDPLIIYGGYLLFLAAMSYRLLKQAVNEDKQ